MWATLASWKERKHVFFPSLFRTHLGFAIQRRAVVFALTMPSTGNQQTFADALRCPTPGQMSPGQRTRPSLPGTVPLWAFEVPRSGILAVSGKWAVVTLDVAQARRGQPCRGATWALNARCFSWCWHLPAALHTWHLPCTEGAGQLLHPTATCVNTPGSVRGSTCKGTRVALSGGWRPSVGNRCHKSRSSA